MQKILRIKNDIHELTTMNQFLEEAVSNIIFYAYREMLRMP
ncbi:hypothetical protein [Parabacteroides distasonis]|nr:hypothetical protein [Parabacteroides distasonis]